ncbi:MAG TPA: metallophosphoesterase, partial [Gemmatimonadaceae bacterium]|nr:metallophosphoesterase [Gemmatimonadaceae bacterium]
MADSAAPSEAARPRRPLRGVSLKLRVTLRLVAYFLGCWGFAAVLCHGLFPHAEFAVVGIAVYTTVPLLIFLRWRGFPFYPGKAFRLLVIRPFWYIQLTLPLLTVVGAAGVVIGAVRGTPLAGGRVAAAGLLSTMIIAMIAGYVGSRQLNLQRLDASIVGLPIDLDGLTIVQLTDLHIGPQTSERFLRRIVDMTMSLAPDLVAVTGDLVDDRAEDVDLYVAALRPLQAPLGVFIIPGNHDVYAGWDAVRSRLDAANVGRVLVNESYCVRRGGAALAIVGTGDPAGRRFAAAAAVAPDIERALANVP